MAKTQVLIVENEQEWQENIQLALKPIDCSFECAQDYKTALIRIKQSPPVIITLDMQLRQDNHDVNKHAGWKLLEESKEAGIPVVVITGFFRDDLFFKALKKFNNIVEIIDKGRFSERINDLRQVLEKAIAEDTIKKLNRNLQVDMFSPLEFGLMQLTIFIGTDHPQTSTVQTFQFRLMESIQKARRYGDTGSNKAERNEIVEQLNILCLSIRGSSFYQLCHLENE